jgi:predicted site-specific integrase-resolvase
MIEVERHYRTTEAAEILSVHPRTIQGWVRAGDLAPVVYISPKDIRIPASTINSFLGHRTVRRGALALA